MQELALPDSPDPISLAQLPTRWRYVKTPTEHSQYALGRIDNWVKLG